MEELRIEILIGGGLDVEEDTGPALRLFGGDFDRAAEFKTELRKAIGETLEACDIKMTPEAADVLHVMIYGRSVSLTEHQVYQMSLLEVRVLRDSPEECDCQAGQENAIKSLLGFVEDKDLEKSLISQVQAILAGAAGCRPRPVDPSMSG